MRRRAMTQWRGVVELGRPRRNSLLVECDWRGATRAVRATGCPRVTPQGYVHEAAARAPCSRRCGHVFAGRSMPRCDRGSRAANLADRAWLAGLVGSRHLGDDRDVDDLLSTRSTKLGHLVSLPTADFRRLGRHSWSKVPVRCTPLHSKRLGARCTCVIALLQQACLAGHRCGEQELRWESGDLEHVWPRRMSFEVVVAAFGVGSNRMALGMRRSIERWTDMGTAQTA